MTQEAVDRLGVYKSEKRMSGIGRKGNMKSGKDTMWATSGRCLNNMKEGIIRGWLISMRKRARRTRKKIMGKLVGLEAKKLGAVKKID